MNTHGGYDFIILYKHSQRNAAREEVFMNINHHQHHDRYTENMRKLWYAHGFETISDICSFILIVSHNFNAYNKITAKDP